MTVRQVEFDFAAALIAGLTAGIAMSTVRATIRAAGVPLRLDVVRVWGAVLGRSGSTGLWAGLVAHLAVSAAVGLVYALAFDLLAAAESLWLWGVIGGVIHYLVGGAALGLIRGIQPGVPARRTPPGPYARRLGMPDAAAFLAAHLAFGLVFALAYGFLHPAAGAASVV